MPTPFNQTWRPLDRAFALARLEALEAILVTVARELSYSVAVQSGRLPDPLPFRFRLSRIAADWSVDRKSLRIARDRLIRDHVLVDANDGLRINKRFHEWSGPHKLTRQQLATARDAAKADAITRYGTVGGHDVERSEPNPSGFSATAERARAELDREVLPRLAE